MTHALHTSPHVTLVEDTQTTIELDPPLPRVTPFEMSPNTLLLKYGRRVMELDLR